VANTSLTGGYLAPEATPAPLEGQELLRFLQQYVVGITGLDGELVRPRWQPEPPNIPNAGVAWAAIGVSMRVADTFPFVGSVDRPVGLGSVQMQNHEVLSMLCSFYDLGAAGLADSYASRLRDGVQIAQNREPLFNAGMGLVDVSDMIPVPVLLKMRWLYRVDLTVRIRRVVVREYPVRTVVEAEGTVQAQPDGSDEIITEEFDVTSNP
jgi:hypothetical protein